MNTEIPSGFSEVQERDFMKVARRFEARERGNE